MKCGRREFHSRLRRSKIPCGLCPREIWRPRTLMHPASYAGYLHVGMKKIYNFLKKSELPTFILLVKISWLISFCGFRGGNEKFAEIRAGSLSRAAHFRARSYAMLACASILAHAPTWACSQASWTSIITIFCYCHCFCYILVCLLYLIIPFCCYTGISGKTKQTRYTAVLLTRKVWLGIYCTQIQPSDHDIIAMSGEWFDITGHQDSKHGSWLTCCEFQCGK